MGILTFATMVQEISIGIIFLAALGYVGRLVYTSFQARNACSTGCGKCNTSDLSKIEKQLSKSSFAEISMSKSETGN